MKHMMKETFQKS